MSAQIPQQSQFQGPQVMYIKQLEDIMMPYQPFSPAGFGKSGQDLVQVRQFAGTGKPIQMPLHRDFLPMKANYGMYLANKETGYVENKITYPEYTTGFRSYGF